MNQSDILAAVTPVVEALDALGVPYHIGGSVVSSLYGIPRATLDVDLVADLRERQIPDFVRQLEASYYVSEEAIREACRSRASFNVIHLETMLKVDVFVLKQTPFEQEVFTRRRCDTLDEADGARSFFVASAEDIVLHKLHWYRLGGEVSDRQWGDILGVLEVRCNHLDITYLRHWAINIDVVDLLETALREADVVPTE